MFNAEVKEGFVKSYTDKISVRVACKQFFDIAQKYEEQWGADLYTRTIEELTPFLDDVSGLTVQSRKTTLSILKSYIRWCMAQNDILGVCEDILKINSVPSDKFKTQTVTSPIHLQRYLDSVFAPVEDKTVENIYRTYFWMAYAGINQNDVFKVKNKDVDFSEMVIRYNEKVYPIYREGIKAIKYCVELDYIRSERTNTGKFVILDRIDSDLVMRGRKSVFTSKSMQERTSRKQREALDSGKTDLRLSYFKVWISGLFYRMYMDEISGIKPDFLPFVKEIDSVKGTKNRPYELKNRAKYYHEDYLCWKDSLNR